MAYPLIQSLATTLFIVAETALLLLVVPMSTLKLVFEATSIFIFATAMLVAIFLWLLSSD